MANVELIGLKFDQPLDGTVAFVFPKTNAQDVKAEVNQTDIDLLQPLDYI